MLLILLCFVCLNVSSMQLPAKLLGEADEWNADIKAGTSFSVIVHLAHDGEVSFAKAASTEDVAAAVKRSQNQFLGELSKSGMLRSAVKPSGKEPGLSVTKLMTYQHAVVGWVSDPQTLEYLASRADVRYIERNELYELYTVEGRQLTGSDDADTDGWRGQGIGVAVIDTNFDLLHPELGGAVGLPNGVVFGGRNISADNDQIHSRTWNACSHGTATASIVRRYAPDAHLYTLVAFPLPTDADIAAAINWCITNRAGINGGNPIRVISMSLGKGQHSGYCNSGLVHNAAGDALANDILLLASSGNNAWTSATGSPSCSTNVISVGAVWDATGAPYTPFGPAFCNDSNRLVNERTCYSNTSWALNVYAPSEQVLCARCGGGVAAFGGTSAACPAAAGMVAQLLSFDLSFAGEKDAVVEVFTDTGAPVSGEPYPKRRINIEAAIESCDAAPAQPSYITGPSYDPCPYTTITYQTPAVPNAYSYEWELVGAFPGPMTTSSPSFDLFVAGYTPGWYTLRVRAINCAGVSPWRNASIRILSSSDPQCGGCTGKICD